MIYILNYFISSRFSHVRAFMYPLRTATDSKSKRNHGKREFNSCSLCAIILESINFNEFVSVSSTERSRVSYVIFVKLWSTHWIAKSWMFTVHTPNWKLHPLLRGERAQHLRTVFYSRVLHKKRWQWCSLASLHGPIDDLAASAKFLQNHTQPWWCNLLVYFPTPANFNQWRQFASPRDELCLFCWICIYLAGHSF